MRDVRTIHYVDLAQNIINARDYPFLFVTYIGMSILGLRVISGGKCLEGIMQDILLNECLHN